LPFRLAHRSYEEAAFQSFPPGGKSKRVPHLALFHDGQNVVELTSSRKIVVRAPHKIFDFCFLPLAKQKPWCTLGEVRRHPNFSDSLLAEANCNRVSPTNEFYLKGPET
jgi:hypothetical protein